MTKVTGIGGIFFKCNDPTKVKDWYKENLAINTDQWGSCFEWRQADDGVKKGFTQWSPMANNSEFFGDQEFMINYRVDNIEALVKELKLSGITILDNIETYEYGKFVHILDAEGKKVELWEPIDEEFDKIVGGRTK